MRLKISLVSGVGILALRGLAITTVSGLTPMARGAGRNALICVFVYFARTVICYFPSAIITCGWADLNPWIDRSNFCIISCSQISEGWKMAHSKAEEMFAW